MEQEQVAAEILKLRSDINSLGNKLVAAEYSRTLDVEKVVKEVNSLREQANMLMHHVAPIEEIHEKSLQTQARMEKVEVQLRKRDELRKLMQGESLRYSWLPVFALIQLALSWAIFFK